MTLSVRLCVTFSIQRNKESNVYCSLLSPYTSISLYVSIWLRIRHVYGHLITPNIRYFMQCDYPNFEEQEWRSDENACLPPMWPGFGLGLVPYVG